MKLNSESLLSVPVKKETPELMIERPSLPPGEVAEGFKPFTFRIPQVIDEKKTVREAALERSDFSRQYSNVYTTRLFDAHVILEEKVKEEWQCGNKTLEIKKIAELCEDTSASHNKRSPADAAGRSPSKKGRNKHQQTDDHMQHIAMREDVVVVIIGTIFKHQPEKPSILQDLVEDNPMVPLVPKTSYISDKDSLTMEDNTSRVHLVPSETCGLSVAGVVNGIVCAVKGKPTIHGKFEVEDVLWATPSPCVWPKKRKSDIEMIFVSGLHLGSHRENMAHVDLLCDFLQGLTGCPDELESNLKSKARLFIVGETFGDVAKPPAEFQTDTTKKSEEDLFKVSMSDVAYKLDETLDELSETMDVYILPGDTDPVEPMFPQAPFHRCILPKASRHTTFHSMTNPTRLTFPFKSEQKEKSNSKDADTFDIIMCGGQNITDGMKNCDVTCPLEMANTFLKWGHLCPTAPDTLSLHPWIKGDCFIVNNLPNIMVVGGQEKFNVREWKGTIIVTLPKFAETGVAVVCDKNMNFIPLTIQLYNK